MESETFCVIVKTQQTFLGKKTGAGWCYSQNKLFPLSSRMIFFLMFVPKKYDFCQAKWPARISNLSQIGEAGRQADAEKPVLPALPISVFLSYSAFLY